MKKCEWCPNEATTEIVVELRRSTFNTNTPNALRQSVKANRKAPCCAACYRRLSDGKVFEKSKKSKEPIPGQLDVYDVLGLIAVERREK